MLFLRILILVVVLLQTHLNGLVNRVICLCIVVGMSVSSLIRRFGIWDSGLSSGRLGGGESLQDDIYLQLYSKY